MKKVRSKLHPTKIGKIKVFNLSPDDEVGEIAVECTGCTYYYDNLADFCGSWEDYEEPKEYWTVDCGLAIKYTWNGEKHDRAAESVGLKFDTKEECERAIEKLKAWKRLEADGFKFNKWEENEDGDTFRIYATVDGISYDVSDLDLLFNDEDINVLKTGGKNER